MFKSVKSGSSRAALAFAASAVIICAPVSAQTNVSAADFIDAAQMESELHRVLPNATSNGFSNTYEIQSPGGLHAVEGTNQVMALIKDIHAADILKQRSTVGAIANSAKNRTLNLVETPIRILGSVGNELSEVETTEDALLFIPMQTGNLIGKFAEGASQLGVTGARIAKGAAGTRCSGFQCAEQIGKDVWSGLNSLTGKHDVTRKLHAELGTSSETTYQPLKNQIDRISYADAYTGTAYKFGLGVNGYRIDHFSQTVTGVGYANNAEFLASYQDADRKQNSDKDDLASWGVSQDTIDALYANTSFSKLRRFRLVEALRAMNSPREQTRLARGAARANSTYNANAHIQAYEYIAAMAARGDYQGLATGAPVAIAVNSSGAMVMPIVTDYLLLTPSSRAPMQMLARLSKNRSSRAAPEIHIIGTASDEFVREAARLGITVKTVSG